MCDRHLFTIIVPNDWTTTVKPDDNDPNRFRVNIKKFSFLKIVLNSGMLAFPMAIKGFLSISILL